MRFSDISLKFNYSGNPSYTLFDETYIPEFLERNHLYLKIQKNGLLCEKFQVFVQIHPSCLEISKMMFCQQQDSSEIHNK